MQESKGWQGNPILVKLRERLISNFVTSCRLSGEEFIKIDEKDLENRGWYRASGEVVCELCGLTYDKHPRFPYSYDSNNFNSDIELCNGDLVKL